VNPRVLNAGCKLFGQWTDPTSRLPDRASLNRNDCSGPDGSRSGTSNASAGVKRRSSA
jgi:hypothetical protein